MNAVLKHELLTITKCLQARFLSDNAEENSLALKKLTDLIRAANESRANQKPFLSAWLLDEISKTSSVSHSDILCVNNFILESIFPKFLRVVLENISIETANKIPKYESHVKTLVNHGPVSQTYVILCETLLMSRSGFSQVKMISLMEYYLNEKLFLLLLQQCKLDGCTAKIKPDYLQWNEVLTALTSFPDKAAGKLQSYNSDLFQVKRYVEILGSTIMEVLLEVHSLLLQEKECDLEFISRLIGKICLLGYADMLWNCMLEKLCLYVKEDYVWCRISEHIVAKVSNKCTESVVVPLLQKIPSYKDVDKFLGDSVITNKKLQYLLCTKLLFHRHFEETRLLKNVLGYLASSHTRRILYLEVMKNLLSVWGDGSAIKHTSDAQHLFISRALMICIGHLNDKEKSVSKNEFLRILMPAIQCHIGSGDVNVRKLGMVVAETLTTTIDPTGPKLQFEYQKDKDVLDLLSYLKIDEVEKKMDTTESSGREQNNSAVSAKTLKTTSANKKSKVGERVEELDSDDDLEPYNMSNDIKVIKTKIPKYIRDCMEGLICSDDAERVEACLLSSEMLIRKCPDGLKEIAVEFTKILLHLADNFSSVGFETQRFGAMVALTVHCPNEVATYLTGQFYERNYNLRQRMDILEVLSAAAQELSRPVDNTKPCPKDKVTIRETEVEDWRETLNKRIVMKTRKSSKAEPAQVANRFTNVAGYFFFPLLTYYDRPENSFDLLGEDTVVLRKLVFSLGLILYAALHIPFVQQMCTSLLEFVWCLRYHTDSNVRQSLLFATSMVVLVIPPFSLMSDLQTEIMEIKGWLEEIVEKDPNTECKKMALQVLVLLENTLKQGIQMN